MFTEHELDLIVAALGRQGWWLKSLEDIGGRTEAGQGEVLTLKAKAINILLEMKKEASAKAMAKKDQQGTVEGPLEVPSDRQDS